MTDTSRANAAIWYAEDGYKPETKGINGRRVAGASFLSGFLRHAEVDEFVGLCAGDASRRSFEATVKDSGRNLPVRTTTSATPQRIAPTGVVYFPAPNYAEELWRRHQFGHHAYAICGITHTTATRAVTEGLFTLRAAPQMPWDAIICTSRAVHASLTAQMEVADSHLSARFGGTAPPRPLMPVIPLGIDAGAFARSEAARAALRGRMGWGEKDIVITTLSRLAPYGKFDPLPFFLAMQRAQKLLGDERRLHYVACGIYLDTHSQKVFEGGARSLMPDVGYVHLDGADAQARSEALSGADIFAFPIDNVQETFGLAPIEAMAAGLPVLTTDWDGMRDTVTNDVGIRVATRSLPSSHTRGAGLNHVFGRMNYASYTSGLAAVTEIELSATIRSILTLARDGALRARLGAAGQRRAHSVYDWSVIIPQMQALWAEQDALRRRFLDRSGPVPTGPLPIALPPAEFFAAYATRTADTAGELCVPLGSAARLQHLYTLRRHASDRPAFEKLETLEQVLAALQEAAPAGADGPALARATGLPVVTAERCLVWLLKYGMARRLPTDGNSNT